MIHPIENWRTYDDRGVMMPWYTRPCLEWLEKLPLDELDVFEYGCGVSSLWYLSRGATVAGVDTKSEWCFLPHQYTIPNAKGYVERVRDIDVGDGEHFAPIDYFHLIIIDGDFRDDCTEHALKHLKKGGYLICDNFEQPSADLAHWPKTRELTKNLPGTFYKEPEHEDWVSAVWRNI